MKGSLLTVLFLGCLGAADVQAVFAMQLPGLAQPRRPGILARVQRGQQGAARDDQNGSSAAQSAAQPAAQGASPGSAQVPAAPAQQTSATPAARVTPGDMAALLQKIYMAGFRAGDLLSVLQTDKWKMDDAERQSLNRSLDAVRNQLKTLEQWRYQFSSQPENRDLGDKTLAALDTVRTGFDAVVRSIAQYEGAEKSSDYRQAADQLTTLQQKLETYLASTGVASQPAAAAQPTVQESSNNPAPPSTALQTENITAPAAAPPPANSVETPESVRTYQAKVMVHKIYIATFRVKDLLSVLHPEHWKIPQPLREAFNERLAILRKDVASLDNERVNFDQEPDDAYLGFEVYLAIAPVIDDVKRIAHDAAQFGDPAVAADFKQPAQWLDEAQRDIKPYIGFILENREKAIHGYQADLAACQNTLNYALRPKIATPMPNFMPVLKGVRPARRNNKSSDSTTGVKKSGEKTRGSGQ